MEDPKSPETDIAPAVTPPVQNPNRKHRRRTFLLIVLAVIIIAAGAVYAHHALTKKTPLPSTASTAKNSAAKPQATSTNVWKGSVDLKALPLGDGHVSTKPQVGYVDSCMTSFTGKGAFNAGSWINSSNGTWNSEAKLAVEGAVSWPNAAYKVTTSGNSRIITTNDLPETELTGNFPIASTDPAYQYDRNPNHIATQTLSYTLPLNPTAAAAPSCTGMGVIGVLNDGVVLYNGLDAEGRDAVAHEVQDSCNGHPDSSEEYHYHDIPSCIMGKATGSSTLVGYAVDGYGIYVERDKNGNLPTDADLDACHGRTSQVMWNGKLTNTYHYDATLEYPYTVGCYHGTPLNTHPAGGGSGAANANRAGNPPPPAP